MQYDSSEGDLIDEPCVKGHQSPFIDFKSHQIINEGRRFITVTARSSRRIKLCPFYEQKANAINMKCITGQRPGPEGNNWEMITSKKYGPTPIEANTSDVHYYWVPTDCMGFYLKQHIN